MPPRRRRRGDPTVQTHYRLALPIVADIKKIAATENRSETVIAEMLINSGLLTYRRLMHRTQTSDHASEENCDVEK